jgi:ABC-type Fe3+/spermidine/putrescine transport system ATPase subunit
VSATAVAPPAGARAPGRGKLDIEGVTHRYGDSVALRDVDLHVADGEFVTFLGPSGCGKTTMLRIIAGFTKPTEGRIRLQDEDVTRVPPHKRWTQMVFQRPTLFPHLDVFENIAFGLRVAKVDGAEIRRRIGWALDLVRLPGFEHRRAHELSGGQMQRIAMARAIVLEPKVLLLDEPLSALDLKIRLEMEVELRRVHRETGATFIYVTHDQREALALSDRIVVFNDGQVEQVGTAEDIYRRPGSAFAARFVGDANVLPVTIRRNGGGEAHAELAGRRLALSCGASAEGSALLVLRPEAVRLAPGPDVADALPATVHDVAFRGSGFTYRLSVEGLDELVKAEVPAGAGPPHEIGAQVALLLDESTCSILAGPGGPAGPGGTAPGD